MILKMTACIVVKVVNALVNHIISLISVLVE